MGEKTGWTFIEIPLDIAQKIKPDYRKAFRVKGMLDNYSFEGISILPLGEGNYLLALNASIRKSIKKQSGDTLLVQLEEDKKEKKLSRVFMDCLKEEPSAMKFFKSLPPGHQRYFSNWIETAKTEATKARRIAEAINALAMHLGFGEMIRRNQKKKKP